MCIVDSSTTQLYQFKKKKLMVNRLLESKKNAGQGEMVLSQYYYK